jgi:proteasome accessory factor B
VARTPPSERLLNLVIALLNTRRRLTREEIRTTVVGYADASSDAAFERMFERDKDILRELGIPLTTVGQDGAADDVGYLIDQQSWALTQIDLTPAELGVLSLAAELWHEQSTTADAVRGVSKLRASTGFGQEGQILVGFAPRLGEAGKHLRPLLGAIAGRHEVTFRYRAASTGETISRSVQPWRVYTYGGGWYLLAFDTLREEPRSFRLSRIQGKLTVSATGDAFPAPTEEVVQAARGSEEHRTAKLAIAPNRLHALRARANGTGQKLVDRDVVTVEFGDLEQLVDELVSYGDGVLVLEPADVKDSVLARLRVAAQLGVDSG